MIEDSPALGDILLAFGLVLGVPLAVFIHWLARKIWLAWTRSLDEPVEPEALGDTCGWRGDVLKPTAPETGSGLLPEGYDWPEIPRGGEGGIHPERIRRAG